MTVERNFFAPPLGGSRRNQVQCTQVKSWGVSRPPTPHGARGADACACLLPPKGGAKKIGSVV